MSDPAQLSFEDPIAGVDRKPAATRSGVGVPPEPLTSPLPPTAEQATAIEARERDVFLEAGAGTGKTRVLVDRYCDAVDLDGVEPERILAFTFTERAASEMRRRVRVELMRRSRAAEEPERSSRLRRAARAGEGAPITTIHGFCRRLLGAYPVAAGLDPNFRVLDADEATRLSVIAFEAVLAELAATDDDVARAAAGYRNRLRGLIRAAHDECRNQGSRVELPPIQITAFEGDGEGATDPAALELADASYQALRRLLVAFAERYSEAKAERSGVDFDDLQLLTVELIGSSAAIARAQQERFDHLLIDEFQDTSPLQVTLVRSLCGPETRLFTVGDEFQSIYAFRGADLESFRAERERIRERLGDGAVLPLSGSFRSDPTIVAAVNVVGECLLDDFRPLRVGREPEGERPGPQGASVEVLAVERKGWNDGIEIKTTAVETAANRIAEARNLARHLRLLADDGVDPASMVLLLRAFSHVDAYAEALELAGLDPYVVGGRGYWSAQQVEDALRLLACVANPLDDEPLFGALASPACGASPDALWMLRRMAGRGRHIWPALEGQLLSGEAPDPDEPSTSAEDLELWRRAAEWAERMSGEDRGRIERFARLLVDLRERAPLLPLDGLVEATLETFDYDLAALAMPGGNRRAANLLKLIRLAGEYESHEGRDLRGFLLYARDRAALSDREAEASVAAEDHPGITVMTIHAAKGLEFDCVAVADLGRAQVTAGAPPDLRLSFGAGGLDASRADQEPEGEGNPEDDDEWLGPRVGLRLARAGGKSLTLDGYTEIQEAAAAAESQESGRLAYVAASRARRRLILSGLFDPQDLDGGHTEPKPSHSVLSRLLPALGATDTAHLEVKIAPATARGDLDATFEPPTVAVHVLGAGEREAAELGFEMRPPAPDPDPGDDVEPPMLALAERGGSAARGLSYAALADYNRCGYRFLAERVLGLGSEVAAAGPLQPHPDDAAPTSNRFGFGRAVHDLLETSARDGWRAPGHELIAATLAREGVAAGRAEDATGLLNAWLESDLLAELAGAGARFRPEVPFRIALGSETIMRGTIDLLVEVPGRPPLVIDYKTDAEPPAAGEPLSEDYEIQRSLYAHAVAEATDAPEVASAYVFLADPARSIRADLDAAAIAAGRERIEALIAGIRARRFEATDTPHRSLCHDCPARPRLCPHPKERTLAVAPAA